MTKDEVLRLLQAQQTPLSGQEMSRALGVSRGRVYRKLVKYQLIPDGSA